MSPGELASFVDWIEDRWPGTRSWRHVEKPSVAADFARLPEKTVWEAGRNYYDAGHRTAPTIPEVREAARTIARATGEFDPQAVDCDRRGSHRAMAIAPHGTDNDGNPLREGLCIDCHTMVIRPEQGLRTVGEAAAAEEEARIRTPAAADDVVSTLATHWSETDRDNETDDIAP